MRDNGTRWQLKLAQAGWNRRRFLGGAAAGAGVVGLTLAGCSSSSSSKKTPAASASAAPSGSAKPSGSATPGGSPTPKPQKGGRFRATSANNTWDTFDIDRSRFTPFAVLASYTNQGIMQWQSYADNKITGSMAESVEQPDNLTYTFKLRGGTTWHNKPPANGRLATPADMAFFVNRNHDAKLQDGTADPNFYRASNFANVASATATDSTTMTVKLSKPDPFFIQTLANPYSKVQAPEAVKQFEKLFQNLKAEYIIGTGGFVLTSFDPAGKIALDRFDKFYTDVWFDGIDYVALFTDQSAQQAAFQQEQIDVFSPTSPAVTSDLKNQLSGKIFEQKQYSANPQAGTYYGGAAPWSNQNLIGGIFRALDRYSIANSLEQGLAVVCGSIPPSQAAYGIDEKELATLPGYLTDRATDEAEAKKMWEAGGGSALGEIIVDIPDIWEGLYKGASALITNKLHSVLGNTFTAKIQTYATITTKIVKQQYGNGTNSIWYGWVTDVSGPDPSQLNFLTYNSTSAQWKQFGVKIPEVDTLTAQALTELDNAKRADLNKQVDRLVLKNWGAGVPYNVNGVGSTLYWNYVHPIESASFVNENRTATDAWFNQSDPTWSGRK